MNKYLVICVDGDDGLFAEQYTIEAGRAQQALQRAIYKNLFDVGFSQKEANEKSRFYAADCRRCSSNSGQMWATPEEGNMWLAIKQSS